jgi:hypothetical protein
MQGIVHFHQQHLCTSAQQIMTQKIVQNSWERSKKKGTKTTRMSSGFLQKPGMIGESLIYSLEEELVHELMQQKKIQRNTNGLRIILSHKSSLTHEKKRKHLSRPDKFLSRKMLHLH